MTKRIAIIGAGWMGIGCLAVLKNNGYLIDVYEKNDDIGGVWHPSNCYANLGLHGAALTVEYHDFPLPQYIDKTQSMSSGQIYDYLKSYCTAKKLYPHIRFNVQVYKINYNSQRNTCTLHAVQNTQLIEPIEYDYVVYTHGFTDKTLPTIKNSHLFLDQSTILLR